MTVSEQDNAIATALQEKEKAEKRAAIISAIHSLAVFLDDHPEVEIPYICLYNYQLFNISKEDVVYFVKGLGRVKKEYMWDNLYITKIFNDDVKIKFVIPRSCVCQRVVKETRIIPAEPEHTEVIPAKKAHVEEIVEWVCEPILAPEKSE